jgi:hypothetical protein
MKRIYVALFCGFIGILLMGAAIPPKVNGQAEAEIFNGNLVAALRLLNTQEYNYRDESGRFAALQEKAACKTAAFSDDNGLIYLGYVMDCRSPTR